MTSTNPAAIASFVVGAPVFDRDAFARRATRVSAKTELIVAENDAYIVEDGAVIELSDTMVQDASLTIVIGRGAKVTYVSKTIQGNVAREIFLEEGAELDWIDIVESASDATTHLIGERASAKLRTIFIANDERPRVHARMLHHASRTASNMLTRGALLGSSHATYEGKIMIAEHATGCEAYQRADALVLSNTARIDAEPILEILNDDVRCSHGVTIGRVQEEQKFYLMSRGLTAQQAQELLVTGFFDALTASAGGFASDLRRWIASRLQRELDVKADFPLLNTTVRGKTLTYLDSAASAQKPRVVLDEMNAIYESRYANVHRGIYKLAEASTEKFESARACVAEFLHVKPEEIIFTRGTTDGVNMLADGLAHVVRPGDEIVVSIAEHHSNFVPWQQLCERTGATFKTLPLTPDFQIDLERARTIITSRTKIVAIAHASNVLGTVFPVREIAQLAHDVGALVVVDGAQAIAHRSVHPRDLGAGAYVFSAHKLYAPEGIGVLWCSKALLKQLKPSRFGGEMVRDVTIERTEFADAPYCYEAGTPSIAQASGLAAAINYLASIGSERIQDHERDLTSYTLEQLRAIPGLSIIGPSSVEDRIGAFSFVMDRAHPHDVAQILDRSGVCVRAGHHCAQPLHCALGLQATIRASIGVYTTRCDIDKLIEGLHAVRKVFP
jgi:cysteine desulfurase/selenocysteine lyase